MTTNTGHRRRETDRLGPYVQQAALDKANARIAELEAKYENEKSEFESLKAQFFSLKDNPLYGVWIDGHPTKFYAEEWFIAKLDTGAKVVLRALPEEYAYDFTTADETYYKSWRIKKWMQFPESQFLPPPPAEKQGE